MTALPEAFLQRMREQLGPEYPDFLHSYEAPFRRGIRLNPLKPCDEKPDGVLPPVTWEPTGYLLDGASAAGAVPLHEAGAWYLQEPGAMLPAAVLDARPGERVLDLCAAPGGKATQSALRMAGHGLLIANEPVPKRAQVLSANIERMGIVHAAVVSALPDALAKRWPGFFDAVQVDAPCSGEGMFRRHPETVAEWTPDAPERCAARQADILDAAAAMVRPGGRLVYSTCTFNRAENEDTVAAFLARHPDFRLKPFSLPGADAPEGMLTCWPHRMPTEGQFTALLVREGTEEASKARTQRAFPAPDRQRLRLWRDFAPEGSPEPNAAMGDVLLRVPEELPPLDGLKVLRCGLKLGEARGKLFLPDHAWAMAAERPAFPTIPIHGEEALRWLRGEELSAPENLRGWALPTLNGLALGWGKASGGALKNHYPKGLRRSDLRLG